MNESCEITLDIGGMPILLHMQDDSFRQLLARRYAGFIGSGEQPKFEFDKRVNYFPSWNDEIFGDWLKPPEVKLIHFVRLCSAIGAAGIK